MSSPQGFVSEHGRFIPVRTPSPRERPSKRTNVLRPARRLFTRPRVCALARNPVRMDESTPRHRTGMESSVLIYRFFGIYRDRFPSSCTAGGRQCNCRQNWRYITAIPNEPIYKGLRPGATSSRWKMCDVHSRGRASMRASRPNGRIHASASHGDEITRANIQRSSTWRKRRCLWFNLKEHNE